MYSAEIDEATEETAELYEKEMIEKEMTNDEEHEYHCNDCKVLYAHLKTEEMLSDNNNHCERVMNR